MVHFLNNGITKLAEPDVFCCVGRGIAYVVVFGMAEGDVPGAPQVKCTDERQVLANGIPVFDPDENCPFPALF